MKILAIETSCDETAIAVLDNLKVLSNQVLSQIKIHKKFGGVVPNLAMREHKKNLPVILKRALKEAKIKKSDIAAVTYGPGLEPALWEGINFAKDLAKKWKVPLVGVNHLEGHIYASWLESEPPKFPILALIVSGGHTELVLMKKHLDYKILGETRDDAAGEAFDKVARMLGLCYPGGPEISKLAEKGNPKAVNFPRPMINSGDFDFSFSGLKTAVLYHLRSHDSIKFNRARADIAASFQQSVVDVLTKKTADALRKYKPKSLVVGGGVAANHALHSTLNALIKKSFPKISLHISPLRLTGDNAAMIAAAGYFKAKARKFKKPDKIKAIGNLKLSKTRKN